MFLACMRGDTSTWTFEVFDGDSPRDLTGDFLRFTVKNALDDLDSQSLLRFSSTTSGLTVLPQSGTTLGQFTVTVLPADIASLAADLEAFWDIQLTLADGSVVTPFKGIIQFVGDVTHNTGSIATDT